MDCLFCKMVNKEIECKKIYEDDLVIAILDLHPDSNYYTLIVPKKHYEDVTTLDDDIILHINKVAKKLAPVLIEKANGTSLSIRVNYKDSQFIKHYHLHLLPDYGFKKCTISQEEAYELLKDSFK